MTNFLLVLAALLLVLLNGFFVAAEFGLVKLRQTRIRSISKTAGFRGRLLLEVHQHLDTYLSACQLGITLASLGLGWIGEPAFAQLLLPVFDLFSIASPELIHGISFVFAFFLISFLHIVVGELAPKSLAIRMPERVSLWTAPALYGFYWLMYPIIWILNASAIIVLKLLGLNLSHDGDTHYSSEELKLILRTSSRGARGKKNADDWKILSHALDFNGLQVVDLMRPISEVVAMHKSASLEQNMQTATQHRFSRYPYFDSDGKTVLGMLHLKDLFLIGLAGGTLDDLSSHVRQVEFVPPTMSATELFRRFRKGAPHLALVGYPGENPVGFLTLDNLLSALVGQIRDEFRQNDNDWVLLEDGTLAGKGSLPLYTLGMAMGVDLDNADVESIGGLIMHKLGDIPTEGMEIVFDQFAVVVKKMDGPRIVLVHVHPKTVGSLTQ